VETGGYHVMNVVNYMAHLAL